MDDVPPLPHISIRRKKPRQRRREVVAELAQPSEISELYLEPITPHLLRKRPASPLMMEEELDTLDLLAKLSYDEESSYPSSTVSKKKSPRRLVAALLASHTEAPPQEEPSPLPVPVPPKRLQHFRSCVRFFL